MALNMEEQTGHAVADPACVREIYVEHIGLIEMVDGNLKITLTVTRDLGDGMTEDVTAARLIASAARVPTGLSQIISFLACRIFMSATKPDEAVHH